MKNKDKKSFEKQQKKLKRDNMKFNIEFTEPSAADEGMVDDTLFYREEPAVKTEMEMKVGKSWLKSTIFSPIYMRGPVEVLDAETVVSSVGEKLLFLDSQTFESSDLFMSNENEEIVSFAIIQKLRIAVCCMTNSLIRVFDIATKKASKTIKLNKVVAKKMLVDPSQKYIAMMMSNSTIQVYDTEHFNNVCNFVGSQGFIHDIIFSPIKKSFVVYSGSESGEIRVWDIMLGK